MRVLQFSAVYSGAQKTLETGIHRYLQKNGQESYILYCTGDETERADTHIYCCETSSARLFRKLMRRFFPKSPLGGAWSALQLIGHMRKIRPDVVHLHTIHHGYILYSIVLRYLARKKIPVVYTVHDMWVFTGGCYHYSDRQCRGFDTGCRHCSAAACDLDCLPHQTGRFFAQKQKLFARIPRICFVSVSDWVYEEMRKSPLQDYPQYRIRNAVEEVPRQAQKQNVSYGVFRILGIAAAWNERKGIHRFLELAHLLGDGYEIILVGEVSENIRSQAPDNIRFAGRIANRAELQRLYATADLHVSMSSEETFGMTFVEAAIAGTRSLGFDSTAIPGVLREVQGIVCPVRVSAVAETIRILRSNREACAFSEEESSRIEKDFSMENMARQYCRVYEEVGRC